MKSRQSASETHLSDSYLINTEESIWFSPDESYKVTANILVSSAGKSGASRGGGMVLWTYNVLMMLYLAVIVCCVVVGNDGDTKLMLHIAQRSLLDAQ